MRACVGLEYKMQSAAQFQQVEDIFIMTNISYSFFAADAALRRCAADAAAASFLFVFIKTLALRIFFFLLSFAKEKKHPVVF